MVLPRASVMRTCALLLSLSFVSLLSFHKNAPSISSWKHPESDVEQESHHLSTLNVASHIFVIGLPTRYDRRLQMERLRYVLGLEFTYADALYHTSPLIQHVMDKIRELRVDSGILLEGSENSTTGVLDFAWPDNIDSLSQTLGTLKKTGSDFWVDSLPSTIPEPDTTLVPLTAAMEDATIAPYHPDLRSIHILTAAKIACWHSHLNVIRQIAENENHSDDVSIILEDDVDMEIDIRERLAGLWEGLPGDWDILFLGHCWSDEAQRPALKVYESSLLGSTVSQTSLHPSRSPKCTHAYALTTRGARRLATMLRYPQFAYSRAIDEALAWLVESGQLKAYSLSPSVVVQRKVDGGDIFKGSDGWKEALNRGVFG